MPERKLQNVEWLSLFGERMWLQLILVAKVAVVLMACSSGNNQNASSRPPTLSSKRTHNDRRTHQQRQTGNHHQCLSTGNVSFSFRNADKYVRRQQPCPLPRPMELQHVTTTTTARVSRIVPQHGTKENIVGYVKKSINVKAKFIKRFNRRTTDTFKI